MVDKVYISNKIKNITFDMLEKEMQQLITIGKNANTISPRSRIGNNIVDYFTFIQNMLSYYTNVKNKNNTKNNYIVLKEVYNICISAINIMRPLNCMEIYTKYNAKRVLNFCAGWGGSTVAAAALKLEAFYGIEINTLLKEPYDKMVTYLKKHSSTHFNMYFTDATHFEYKNIVYDTVFASPPYYFIEKYPNNLIFNSKTEMDELFYKPLFTKTYNGLQIGGHYIINVCKEVYDRVLKQLLGEAHETFPLKKSKRQNDYTEMVYVWKK